MARVSGLSTSTLSALYVQRSQNGHPSAVWADPVRGALYFDEEEALSWCNARRNRPLSVQARRPVDRTGNPDDLVTMAEAARMLGYHGPATIRSYRNRFSGYFPPPDAISLVRKRRGRELWRRSSIWGFADRKS